MKREEIKKVAKSASAITVGKRIKKKRKEMKYTQAKLAEVLMRDYDLGKDQKDISLYEKGKRSCSLTTLSAICAALNTTPNFILWGAEEASDEKTKAIESLDWIRKEIIKGQSFFPWD